MDRSKLNKQKGGYPEMTEKENNDLMDALFEYSPHEMIVVDETGRIIKVNETKKNSGDREPNIGDMMYVDYASGHQINMYDELINCIKTNLQKFFTEMPYGDKYLTIKIVPISGRGALITSENVTELVKIRKDLESRVYMFETIAEETPLIAFLLVDNSIVSSNTNFNQLIGYTQEEIEGKPLMNFLIPDMRKKAKRRIRELLKGQETTQDEYCLISKTGQKKWINITAKNVLSDNRPGLFIAGSDITKLKQKEEEIKKSELELKYSNELLQQNNKLLMQIIEESDVGFYILIDGKIVLMNAYVAKYSGFSQEELLSKNIIEFVLPEDRERVKENAKKMLKGELNSDYEYRIIDKRGNIIHLLEKVASIAYQGRRAVLGRTTEITDIKKKQEMYENQALTDALTGLPNRRNFKLRLDQTIAQCDRNHDQLAVLILDLDGFKSINDTQGHPFGDRFLMAVALRLQTIVKRRMDLVARLGGDEFLILLPQISEDDSKKVAVNINEALAQPFFIDNDEQTDKVKVNVTASIGIAIFPKHGNKDEKIIIAADKALYYSKSHGKNTYCVYDHEKMKDIKTQ